MTHEINQRIKNRRKKLGIRQKKVAKFLGIKESTYSQMERTGNITCETAVKLARMFDTNLDSLILGIEKDEYPPKEEKKEKINLTIEDEFIITPNEKSILTVLRNFTKQDREECIAFIEKKYQNK